MTKKQLVIDAAIELFAQKGVESTSIQQITDKCGISKGAFYLSFKSKEELILAIIDHFMQDISQQIDRSVNSSESSEEKLYNYYFTSLNFLVEHKPFALIFLREQMSSIGDECFRKMLYYEELSNRLLLQMVDEIYGQKIEHTKYDLIVFMQGILKSYMTFILFNGKEINIEKLTEMLVEKTDILAKYSKKTTLTAEHVLPQPSSPLTKELLLQELNTLKDNSLTPLQLDSITVLIKEITAQAPNRAIIVGMCHNLRSNPKCSWAIYLVKHFFEV